MTDSPPAGAPERAPAGGDLAWLWPPLIVGALLRLFSAWFSDPTPGDDIGRMVAACSWSEHPAWLGLSGVWPPVPTYLLGSLIRLGGDPIAWSHAIGWLTSTAAIPFFFLAVRELYGDARRAGLACWMLALYYVHIWMAGTAYVETPYVCALFACMWYAARAARRTGPERGRAAFAAGLAMAVALLFRHEAKLASLILLVWLAREAGPRAALRYAIPALGVLAWQLVEPAFMRAGGGGFAQDALTVAGMKIAEVRLHGSRMEALSRWVVMPAGSPSLIVLALAAAGLWMSRRELARDPWMWLFAIQSVVFLAITIYPGWQPYLRYLFLYVVCLLPHAARALQTIARRRASVVAALLVVTLVAQGVAWSLGRNGGRPLGWLPVYRATPQQSALDAWVRGHLERDRVLSLEDYPPAWDPYCSVLRLRRCDLIGHLRSVSYQERLMVMGGGRLDLSGYDVVLLNPASRGYNDLWLSIPAEHTFDHRDDRLAIVRLRR